MAFAFGRRARFMASCCAVYSVHVEDRLKTTKNTEKDKKRNWFAWCVNCVDLKLRLWAAYLMRLSRVTQANSRTRGGKYTVSPYFSGWHLRLGA